MTCRGLCKYYYKTKVNKQHNWAEHGFAKCLTCAFTVKTDDIYCQCCHQRFRHSVRTANSLNYYYRVTRPKRVAEREKMIEIIRKEEGIQNPRINKRRFKKTLCKDCKKVIEVLNLHDSSICWECKVLAIKRYRIKQKERAR